MIRTLEPYLFLGQLNNINVFFPPLISILGFYNNALVLVKAQTIFHRRLSPKDLSLIFFVA